MAGVVLEQVLDKRTEEPVVNARLDPRKFGKVMARKLCPLNMHKECWANRRFCSKNDNCPNRRFKGNFKNIRIRKIGGEQKMYAIKIKGNDELVFKNKKDLNPFLESLAPKDLQKVFEVSHVVETTLELLPNDAAGSDKKKEIAEISEKFGHDIVTSNGSRTQLSTWANKAVEGEVGFIIGQELKPQMRMRVVSIDTYMRKKRDADKKK